LPTRDVLEGIRDGFLFTPLYLPIAIPYAIAAQSLGLADWQIVLWSALIFAGSAQLACLSALATGAGLVELLVITFMANARHSFVAMVIAPYYSRVPPRWLPVLAFTSSVGAMALLPRRKTGSLFAYGLATQMCQWCIWVGGAALGIWIGPLIPATWAPVIGFAAPAAFIGLLNPMVRENLASGLVVVSVAAALGLGLTIIWPPQICAIVGAIGGSLASLLVPERRRRDHAR
jgi:predicted branched-subunit amino acid permease